MRPTPALMVGKYRHLRLTTKDVKKGFYKGNRTGAMGSHTKYGGYKIDWDRVRTYVVPRGLQDFKLTPFVSSHLKPDRPRFRGNPRGADSPELYLQNWKDENGIN